MGILYAAVAVDETRVGELAVSPDALWEVMRDEGIDLNKMWNAAQILLAGSLEAMEPLMTGEPLNGEDGGYGPPMLATASEVRRVAASLEGLDHDTLAARFSVQTMIEQHAYPEIWDEDAELLRQEAARSAMELLELYQRAASAGHAIISMMY